MVHRCNKEIATTCASLPAGQAREVQRVMRLQELLLNVLLNVLLQRKPGRYKMMKTLG
jgi:hypothetical protein